MKNLALIFIVSFLWLTSTAQMSNDEKLARHYMSKGEYDKALDYTKKLVKKYNAIHYYEMHLTCLKKLEDWKEAEKVIDRQIKIFPHENRFKLDLAELYETIEKKDEAEKIYLQLIQSSAHSVNLVISLSQSFRDKGKYDLALKALEEGKRKNKDYPFQFQTAEIYAITGKTSEMVEELLDILDFNSSYRNTVQTLLSRYLELSDEDNANNRDLLKTSLLKRVQKNPNKTIFSEMLIWVYTVEKNFDAALIQAKALDKREKNDGGRVIEIAREAVYANDFNTALKAYDYVIEKGDKSIFFKTAKIERIHAGYKKIKVEKTDREEIKKLVGDYQNTLLELGFYEGTISLVQELAEIYAYHYQSADKAIELLEKALKLPRLENAEIGLLKIQLADTYLIMNEIWEASLLYSQVEKAFKHEPIGAEAKFKNAKVSYYSGDFSWAQAQLKVLKASTSKLIANDALELSLLITDNMGLDTTAKPMLLFAEADLLIAQRRFEEAFAKFDTLTMKFPFHKLHDNILFKKAQAMVEMYEYDDAINLLLKINASYKYDLLADDALFLIAEIYEKKLSQTDKAVEYYKKVLFEHKGSLLGNEARKRYRKLTGDEEKNTEFKNIEFNP